MAPLIQVSRAAGGLRGARWCQRCDGSVGLAGRWGEVNKIYITTRARFIDGAPVTMLPMRAGKPSKTPGMEKC